MALAGVAFAQGEDDFVDDIETYSEVLDSDGDSVWTNYDSTEVSIRKFDASTLEELKSDPDLQYKTGPAVISIWDRFLMWLSRLFSRIFSVAASTDWGNVLTGLLVIIILTYVILRLLKVDALKMFKSSGDASLLKMTVIEEDIHALDFEKLLTEAIAKGDFRLAIRLQFLQALKMLSDKHYIHWEPGKTNHDYINELREDRLRPGFDSLNTYFEYAWYGNFTVTESLFNRARDVYNQWRASL